MSNETGTELDQAQPIDGSAINLTPKGRRILVHGGKAALIAAAALTVLKIGSLAPAPQDTNQEIQDAQNRIQQQQVEHAIGEAEKPKTETSEELLANLTDEVYGGTFELIDPEFLVLNADTPENQGSVGLDRIQQLGQASIPSNSDIKVTINDPAIHVDGSKLEILIPGMVDGQGRALSLRWNPLNSDNIKVIEKREGFIKDLKDVTMNNGQLQVQTDDGKTEAVSQVSVQIVTH